MPLDDWQFYVVTAAALWGVWALVSPFRPRRAARRPRTPITLNGRRLR